MDDYQEIYEETNNSEEERRDYGRYGYQPEYRELKEYYHNEYPSGYEKSYITREIHPRNNQMRMQDYNNYYSESSLPYNENPYSNTINYNNVPDRIRDYSNYYINEGSNNNLREEYSFPINNRVKIRKKIYKGSQTPQPYIQNNDSNAQEEYIDNYQYYETKNIKDKRIKKYDSITHITGYSNLIPLNRMKNLYGKNYNYNKEYQKDNKSDNNYKLKKNINKVQELQKGKRQYEEFLKNLNSNKIREEEMKLEKLRIERLKQEEQLKLEKIKKERIKEERRRKEEELKIEKLKEQELRRQEDNIRNDKYKINYNKDNENIRKRELIHRINRKENKKYNRFSNNTNIYNNKYDINKYHRKIRSNRSFQDNSKRNKIISLLNVQEKTASLNYPNQNKKVNTYGENFDERKYKREYVNVKDVDDGRIENHIETGISKDGQYLISVSSARKIQFYEGKEENEENEEYEEEVDDNNNIYEVPEKKVEEIISTVTTKRKNLGDNYKFYESKHLYKPNITSFTKHRRRTERTIYGNEEHEKREVKTYNIRGDTNVYQDQNVIEKYEKGGEYIPEDEDNDQVNYNYTTENRAEQQELYENEDEIGQEGY